MKINDAEMMYWTRKVEREHDREVTRREKHRQQRRLVHHDHADYNKGRVNK